nr:hypothetical protein [Gammaproteobacteria bacterium]
MLVHEGGFRIEKDYRDRWFFRRPDGRAVPACGYRPEDVTDGGVDAVEEYFGSDASAEVPLDASAEVQLDASAEVSNCASAEAWRRPPTEAFSGVSRETPRVAVV